MTRRISLFVSWLCVAVLVVAPLSALYFLFNIDAFAAIVKDSVGWPIQWHTVQQWQWFSLLVVTYLHVAIGVVGLYFLRRAFAGFSRGELFNLANCRDLRRFSIFLFVQALAKPLNFAIASILLSLNHPTNERMLSISLGSNEIKAIAVAMILWVMSALLVEGSKLQAENQQFV